MFDPTSIALSNDSLVEQLRLKWLACYMLYDWNIVHTYQSFDNTQYDRLKKVCTMADKMNSCQDQSLIVLYYAVLSVEIENWMKQHQTIINHSTADYLIKKALSELGSVYEKTV